MCVGFSEEENDFTTTICGSFQKMRSCQLSFAYDAEFFVLGPKENHFKHE